MPDNNCPKLLPSDPYRKLSYLLSLMDRYVFMWTNIKKHANIANHQPTLAISSLEVHQNLQESKRTHPDPPESTKGWMLHEFLHSLLHFSTFVFTTINMEVGVQCIAMNSEKNRCVCRAFPGYVYNR
jgi:hypothetical protein